MVEMAAAPAETDLAPSAPTEDPEWRAGLSRQLRCWFGAVIALLVLGPAAVVGSLAAMLPLVGMVAAAAVLSTLLALVVESLSRRSVPIAGHVAPAAVGLGIVAALLTTSPGWAAIGALVGALVAAEGVVLTMGSPTWRRYLVLLAGAIALGFLVSLG